MLRKEALVCVGHRGGLLVRVVLQQSLAVEVQLLAVGRGRGRRHRRAGSHRRRCRRSAVQARERQAARVLLLNRLQALVQKVLKE